MKIPSKTVTKAIAILNSFLLSVRIDQLGYSLISYTKAGEILADGATRGQIRDTWLGDFDLTARNGNDGEMRAGNEGRSYRPVARRRRAFTFGNLLDRLENSSGKEHM